MHDEKTPIDPLLDDYERDKMLRQVHRALIGNPLSRDRKDQGLVFIVTELHRDYYGDEDTQRMGTKEMVMKMWEGNKKFIWTATTLCGVVSVVAWFIEQFILSRH